LMVHVMIMLRKITVSDAFSIFYLEVCMCIWSNKQNNNVQLTRRNMRTLCTAGRLNESKAQTLK